MNHRLLSAQHKNLPHCNWGLQYKAGFVIIKITWGLTLAFQSYEAGLLLNGGHCHGNTHCTANLFMFMCTVELPAAQSIHWEL